MLKITAIAGLLQLCAASGSYYDGWRYAMGAESNFKDQRDKVVKQAKQDIENELRPELHGGANLHRPMMSLLETGGKQGLESMSDHTAQGIGDILNVAQNKIAAIQNLALQARGEYGFSFGGLGMPRPENSEALSVWEAMINQQNKLAKKEFSEITPFSLMQTSSETQSMSTAAMNAQLEASAKKMRSSQGKQMLQFAEMYQNLIENEAKKTEEKMNAMMDKLMTLPLEERKPLLKEYQKLKRDAAIAKEAHETFDTDVDQTYATMAKFPDEREIRPEEKEFDKTVDREFDELLKDPKMQSMMQMSDGSLTASSFLQTESAAQAMRTQVMSVAITAEGRAGLTGVDEEGTEEQGAAQALELLKMFDVHQGHHGSAPMSIASFIQTHDQLSEQQREAAQAKALLERRVSQAMARSAQIDKLLDDAIMDYLSDPQAVEEKPSRLAEIAGAFKSNRDPLYHFTEHPFILRYMEEQKQNALLPPHKVQKAIWEQLLEGSPDSMKMAVIYVDLEAPGTRELKVQQDLLCMKQILQKMKRANVADGRLGVKNVEEEIKVFADVQSGSKDAHRHMQNLIQRTLDDIVKVHDIQRLGDKNTQDYATGLADFVYRIGEGEIAESESLDLAAFKTEHLKRGGLVKADVNKAPAEMCSVDNQNLEIATNKAFTKIALINNKVQKAEEEKKEKKMLTETEKWAQQQRRVEKNSKNHGDASVDVDIKPGDFLSGFANLLTKGKGKESLVQMRAAKAAAREEDSHETPNRRHGANFGLYARHSRFV